MRVFIQVDGNIVLMYSQILKTKLKYIGIEENCYCKIETKPDNAQELKFFVLICFFYLTTSLQVTDYAIARRIVDLHSRLGEAVERIYSVVSSCSCSAVLCLASAVP